MKSKVRGKSAVRDTINLVGGGFGNVNLNEPRKLKLERIPRDRRSMLLSVLLQASKREPVVSSGLTAGGTLISVSAVPVT